MNKCNVCKSSVWPDEVHDFETCMSNMQDKLADAEYEISLLQYQIFDHKKEINRLDVEIGRLEYDLNVLINHTNLKE